MPASCLPSWINSSLYEHQKLELAALSAQVGRLQEELEKLKAKVE